MLNKGILILFFIFSLFNIDTNAQSKLINNIAQDEKIYMLSEIWKEVSYNFCDPQRLQAIKWDSIYRSCIQEAINTKSDYAFYRLLQKFIASIDDGHTTLEFQNIEDALAMGGVPFEIHGIGGKYYLFLFVSDYVKNVPLGAEVERINDLPVQDYMNKFVLPYAYGSTPQWRLLYALGSVFGKGLLGDSIKILFKTQEGNRLNVWFKYMESNKLRAKNLTIMPSFHSGPRYEIMNDSILYLKTNTFLLNYSVKYLQNNADKIAKTKGIIIDLRDNNGGSEPIADSLLMCFLNINSFKTYKSLTRKHNAYYTAKGYGYPAYTSYYKNEVLDTIQGETFNKGGLPTFLQPLVILIGPTTCSAAEDFLLALKMNAPKRAVLIGTPTGGSTGAPLVRYLNNEVYFRICTLKPLVKPGLFKDGIQPDIFYEKTIEEYLQNTDNIISIAKDVIKDIITKEKILTH